MDANLAQLARPGLLSSQLLFLVSMFVGGSSRLAPRPLLSYSCAEYLPWLTLQTGKGLFSARFSDRDPYQIRWSHVPIHEAACGNLSKLVEFDYQKIIKNSSFYSNFFVCL